MIADQQITSSEISIANNPGDLRNPLVHIPSVVRLASSHFPTTLITISARDPAAPNRVSVLASP
jgi:hypothetical protein